MSLSDKMRDFDKRWNITDDSSLKVKFQRFKNAVMTIFQAIDEDVPRNTVKDFCIAFGIQEKWYGGQYGRKPVGNNIYDALKIENNPVELLRKIEILFSLPMPKVWDPASREVIFSRDILIKDVSKALEASTIGVKLVKHDENVIFIKCGEDFLDKQLVNQVLSFLEKSALQHFTDALKSHLNNTAKSRIKSCDSLRRSLEDFLRAVLGNKKGLKENIKELRDYLKEKARKAKMNSHICNRIPQMVKFLDDFFNENCKHKDGKISELEMEFLIYLVATIMRYIQQIK